MTYISDTLQGLTSKQRATWDRKAKALHRRAGNLLSEVISVTGVGHPLTYEVDNALHTTEDLLTALRPEKKR